jgi:hypothetical protein
LNPVSGEIPQHAINRAILGELLEDEADHRLDLLIRVEADLLIDDN